MNKLAVFGHPIEHSLSPKIQTAFAQQFGVELEYSKIDADLNSFEQSLAAFHQQAGIGANITVPLKQKAFELCHQVSSEAKLAQAVNTLMWQDDKLIGWNTDGLGLVQDIVHNHKQAIQGKRILIVGAGGATRGILGPILQQSPSQIMLANRTLSKAKALVDVFDVSILEAIDFAALESMKSSFDIIMNATSASLQNSQLPITPEAFKGCFAYDLMYSKTRETAFTKQAMSCQAMIAVDGFGMLVEQGALGFEIWFGKKPDTSSLLKMSFQ